MSDPRHAADATGTGVGRAGRQHKGTSDPRHDSGAEGRRYRDDGMASAIHASDSRWKVAAEDALATLARTGAEFTADDLRDRVGVLASSPNALGAIIAKAARGRQIVRVGFVQSTRTEAHGRYVSQWRGAL